MTDEHFDAKVEAAKMGAGAAADAVPSAASVAAGDHADAADAADAAAAVIITASDASRRPVDIHDSELVLRSQIEMDLQRTMPR